MGEADADPATPERTGLAATVLMTALMVAEPLYLFTGWEAARAAAHLFMIALLPAAARQLGLREYYLLTLCFALSVALAILHPEPLTAARTGLDQGAFLMAFILLVGLLQEGAQTSPAVSVFGGYLARQPAGRRYLSLNMGTQFMAIVFNMGSVSLLAPLITKAAQNAPDDPLTPIRERRQLSALLRGFAWVAVWSPTAIAPIVLYGLIPGADRLRWILLGFALSVLILFLGYAEDRIRWRAAAAEAAKQVRVTPPFPMKAFLDFSAVCLVLAILVAGIAFTGAGIVPGLMVSSPILLTGWLLMQHGSWGMQGARAVTERWREILRTSVPQSASIAVTLACSGFVGRATAALLPAEELAAALGLHLMPDFVFLTSVAVAVAVLGQFALSPIMMAVFFGSVLGSLAEMPADPTLTALAISAGWALSMTSSPFATVVLVLTRITGKPGALLTWFWNSSFTLFAIAALGIVFYALTHIG